MSKGQADRLQKAVFEALRVIEDTDLRATDVGSAATLAQELLKELRRLRGRRRPKGRPARTADP